jgi:hypothetical protein
VAYNASSFLAPWSSFFVVVGSAAAALTGLMFVVITLVTGTERRENSRAGISTFSTPIVVHFGAALLVSALLCAPWGALAYPSAVIALIGLYGIGYVLRIVHRTRQLSSYQADLEDWICYAILPFAGYAAIFGGAIALPFAPSRALFALAGGALLLVFVGIRNAWDIVTYIAMGQL